MVLSLFDILDATVNVLLDDHLVYPLSINLVKELQKLVAGKAIQVGLVVIPKENWGVVY